MKTKWSFAVLVCICLLSMMGNAPVPGLAQGTDTQIDVGPQSVVGTGFTYQGQLKQSSAPFSGNCDFQFTLWDAPTAGSQVADGVSKPNVAVNRGVFTVADISFGPDNLSETALQRLQRSGALASDRRALPRGQWKLYDFNPSAGADGHSLRVSFQPGAQVVGDVFDGRDNFGAESGEHEHNDKRHRRGWARSQYIVGLGSCHTRL